MYQFCTRILNKRIDKSHRSVGFTLAEVLITLGIIGVVAGMTIPILMQNIQDKQFKESAKKAFSVSAQAVQLMKQDNGGSLTGYYGTQLFEPAFIKYFKVTKDCGWDDCVPWAYNSSDIWKSLYGNKADTERMNDGQFVTNDGMFYAIGDWVGWGGLIFITVDVNGYGKKPNQYGKDIFMFELKNDVLRPMGGDNTSIQASSDLCNRTIQSGIQGLGCMYYVIQGIDY